MSSFYDDASLVVIPSGYKTSKVYAEKPTDGSGDLAFTRTGDTATRVNSAGLIEKVRTNLVLQSNTFSTTWANDDSTETSGQAGYDGTTNAWLLSKTAANGRIGQVLTVSGLATFSIYAKAGTDSWVRLASSDAGVYAYFNLGTGAVGTTGGSTTAAITSVGNGWYRCSISGNSSFTFFNIWVADGNNDTSGTSGNILIQSAQVETGDIATQPILTTTAAVSVGPVANVPRLDYLGSTCPRLILEPQRQNLITFSEQMNNAAWTAVSCTVSANVATSPDGYTNADSISTTAANSFFGAAAAVTISADASTYTQSIFVKWVSGSEVVKLRTALTGGTSVAKESSINIRTGVVVSTDTTAQVVSYGSGWYRISHQITNNSTNTNAVYQFYPTNDGTNTNVIYLWGAQLEAGAYATSYIPTLAASATRGADACSKTGISSLIGQTEGTLYFEGSASDLATFKRIAISSGSYTSSVYIDFRNDGSVVASSWASAGLVLYQAVTPSNPLTRNKYAIAYKSNDWAVYVNGTLAASQSTGAATFNSTLNTVEFALGGNDPFTGSANELLVFKTRLTNAQLASLTSL